MREYPVIGARRAGIPRPVVIVGGGRMGSAFAKAWCERYRVLLHDPHRPPLEGCETLHRLSDMPEGATVLVAVKPQILPSVARQLVPHLSPRTPVVSIAAGVMLSSLKALLGNEVPIVRAMPNTPVAIQRGVTAAFAPSGLPLIMRDEISALFASTGSFLWLDDEAQMDTVTAISGSGPAYFYRFAEALADVAEIKGLPHGIARELARATLHGAGGLAVRGTTLSELSASVTSPGGTTEAALAALDLAEIDVVAMAAVDAAIRRSVEIAQEIV